MTDLIPGIMPCFKGAMHNNSYQTASVILTGVIRGIRRRLRKLAGTELWLFCIFTLVHTVHEFSNASRCGFYCHFSLLMLLFQLSPGGKLLFQSSITKPEGCCCVTAASVSSWPALVMSVICTCLWRPLKYQLIVMFVQGCCPGLGNSSG